MQLASIQKWWFPVFGDGSFFYQMNRIFCSSNEPNFFYQMKRFFFRKWSFRGWKLLKICQTKKQEIDHLCEKKWEIQLFRDQMILSVFLSVNRAWCVCAFGANEKKSHVMAKWEIHNRTFRKQKSKEIDDSSNFHWVYEARGRWWCAYD